MTVELKRTHQVLIGIVLLKLPIWTGVQTGLVDIDEIDPRVYIQDCSLELGNCQKDLFVGHADGLEFIKSLTHSRYQEAR